MKLFLILALILPAPWWQPPPEVSQTMRDWMAQMAIPAIGSHRAYREQRQARDRKGVVWLTFVRVGDDIKEFNRDGRLICHGWVRGRRFVIWALSPDGRWQQVR